VPFINLQINIIEEIEKLTLINKQFEVEKWCLEDAEILIRAGNMIKRELKKNDNKHCLNIDGAKECAAS